MGLVVGRPRGRCRCQGQLPTWQGAIVRLRYVVLPPHAAWSIPDATPQGILLPHEVELLAEAGHAPLTCLQAMTEVMDRAAMPIQQVHGMPVLALMLSCDHFTRPTH